MQLNKRVTAEDLKDFDEVVVATGISPRELKLEGIDHPKVLSYIDVLKNGAAVGKKVAVIGAGGIGFDVSEFLVHDGESTTLEEFTNSVAKSIGGKEVKTHIPYRIAFIVAVLMEFFGKLMGKKERPLLTTYMVKNLGSRLRFSIDKAKRELGWTPKISYRDGFTKTMIWLKTLDIQHLKQK